MSDLEFRPRSSRGAIADVWRATLSQIPTEFGKLTYFAKLRNQDSGVYEHHGLTVMFGEEESRQALESSHAEVFGNWLALPLETQKADLDAYLEELGEDRTVVVSNWLSSRSYQNLVPARARDTARSLFVSDIQVLLQILKHECGAAFPDPDA